MPRTRIKICGITRPQDAQLAADLGADAIGLNFVGGPRRIEPVLAREIIKELPSLVIPVALVSGDVPNAPEPWDLYNALRVFTFQLYASQPNWRFYENECEYWWVRHVASRDDLVEVAVGWNTWPEPMAMGTSPEWRVPRGHFGEKPSALLLDTASPTHLGGTGQTFNWHWIAQARAAGELDGLPPIILAGGLTPDNVADAIRIARPYAVDVSSGVEVPGRPGIKDPAKLRDFIHAVHAADAALSG
jgi:phosphoribosylanthranilate isomerase